MLIAFASLCFVVQGSVLVMDCLDTGRTVNWGSFFFTLVTNKIQMNSCEVKASQRRLLSIVFKYSLGERLTEAETYLNNNLRYTLTYLNYKTRTIARTLRPSTIRPPTTQITSPLPVDHSLTQHLTLQNPSSMTSPYLIHIVTSSRHYTIFYS